MRAWIALITAMSLLAAGCRGPSPEPLAGSGADAPGAPGAPASAEQAATDMQTRWNRSVTWPGPLHGCRDGVDAATRACLLDAMRAAGASEAAITAAGQLSSAGEPAFVSGWQEQAGIGVATVVYPFRANTNEGTRLVASDGQRIDVDDPVALEKARRPTEADAGDPPDTDTAMPFAPARWVENVTLPDGGKRLVFRTSLRTCHACAEVGHVRVGYDFDADGRFIGREGLPGTR